MFLKKYKIFFTFVLLFILCYLFHKINNHSYENFSSSTIPKIIHQTWKTYDLPDNFKRWSNQCKKTNSNFKHKLWSDKDN